MDLKPCPFCGGESEFERFGTGRISTIVVCQDCGCRLESPETFNHGSHWNTRASDELIRELVEALEEWMPSIEAETMASHLMDGFRPKRNPHDEALHRTKQTLAKAIAYISPHAENTPHQPDAPAAE